MTILNHPSFSSQGNLKYSGAEKDFQVKVCPTNSCSNICSPTHFGWHFQVLPNSLFFSTIGAPHVIPGTEHVWFVPLNSACTIRASTLPRTKYNVAATTEIMLLHKEDNNFLEVLLLEHKPNMNIFRNNHLNNALNDCTQYYLMLSSINLMLKKVIQL